MLVARSWTPGLGVALLLAGCANPAAERALFARDALVGMPKSTLLSCAGVPNRQASVGDQEFFTYTVNRVATLPGAPMGWYGGPWRRPYGPAWAWDMPAEVRSYSCEATFTLRRGVVERVVYGGGGDLGECYDVVRNCLAPPPVR